MLSSVDRPLNVLMGLAGATLDLRLPISAMGSHASASAARSPASLSPHSSTPPKRLQKKGTFTFGNSLIPYNQLNGHFAQP